MLSRRLVINLIFFFVVSAGLVVYGFVDLLGNPFSPVTTVSTVFPDASGLYPNFSVELNGVDVGSVSSVGLTRGGARVVMTLTHGTAVPDDVTASIDIANDLGEQVVELTPDRSAPAPALRNGAVIPAQPGAIPADVGQVVASATRLLKAIPANDLNALLAELATSLQGRAGDLRTIVAAGTTFSREFVAYQHQFEQLLANAPPVLDAVSSVGPQLEQALVNTESLVQVLATRRADLTTLLQQGGTVAGQLDQLLSSQSPNLGCLLHDAAQITANLAQPANLTNLSQSLADNQYFFGAVEGAGVTGTAVPLTSGQKANPNQIFLRTRLLLPPASPSGIAYPTETSLPRVKPGAGCSTELGQGVGPASQAGFTPAAGGTLSLPTAAEAQVRGGGDPSTSTSTTVLRSARPAAYEGTGSEPVALLAPLGGVLVPALALAWCGRPSRRRSRRRA